jgi:hypothetical protein
LNAAVIGSAQQVVGEVGEPPLDLVDPAGVRRRVVHVEAGMLLEPANDRRALVGAVVVADEVHVEVLGNL